MIVQAQLVRNEKVGLFVFSWQKNPSVHYFQQSTDMCYNGKTVQRTVWSLKYVFLLSFIHRWLLTSYKWGRRSECLKVKFLQNRGEEDAPTDSSRHFSAKNKSQPWDITLQPTGTLHLHLKHDQKGLVILFWHVGTALVYSPGVSPDFPWGRRSAWLPPFQVPPFSLTIHCPNLIFLSPQFFYFFVLSSMEPISSHLHQSLLWSSLLTHPHSSLVESPEGRPLRIED